MSKPNPFLGYGRVVDGDRFIGRQSERAHLRELMSSGASTLSIVGEHRIGKTSLVHEEFRKLSGCELKICSIWITLSTIPSVPLVFAEMQDQIMEQLQAAGVFLGTDRLTKHAPAEESSYTAFRSFRSFLRTLFARGIRTLVIFDEFDAVAGYEDSKQFVQALRELIDFYNQTGFSAVFISRRSLYHLERQLSGVSNLDGVCEKLYLKPLEVEELERMMRRHVTEWPIEERDVRVLYGFTGGHPYLSEMVLCHAWDQKDVQLGFQSSLSEIYAHYERLCQLLDEDKLLDQLLQLTVGPQICPDLEKIERLTKYGIVLKCSNEGTSFTYKGWSEHFQTYLEKISRERPVWADWFSTENLLRQVVNDTFAQKYGDSWVTIIELAQQKNKEVFDGCRARMEKDIANFGSYASRNLLDYTYPLDLWHLMSRHWSLFHPIFKKDKNYWQERFTTLSKVRTPVAHAREHFIPKSLILTAKAYCEEIRQILNACQT